MGQIIVYVDQGVSGASLKHAVKSLQQEVDLSKHPLKRMDAATLKKENWEEKTALIVIPGGRDVYYHSALSGEGTEKIRKFVEKGGSYLGLCAGAYFGCSGIEFDKGGRLHVCGKRELEFFPGMAIGPAYGISKFSYDCEQGSEAALIHTQGEEYFTYFNGGCFFERAENFPDIEVLGTYAHLEGNPAALIACDIGKGKVILSGVHIEYASRFLPRDNPYIEKIYPLLEKGEEKRREVFRDALKRLSIRLK